MQTCKHPMVNVIIGTAYAEPDTGSHLEDHCGELAHVLP